MRSLIAVCLLSIACTALHATPQYQTCISCHGDQGQGNPALKAPALAGQSASYLARQLSHFKAGIRGSDASDTLGQQMRAMANTLPDQAAIEAVSNYLSTLPRTWPAATVEGNAEAGYKLYNMKCGACHGPNGQGNEALKAPALAGVGDAYLARQFEQFKTGVRGSHPQDRPGRQMKMMATHMSSAELHDVLAYLNGLAQ
ncbi:cytochrome c [Simiduia sp. 21SJ11W-1]|uniref:c-type cytochrome n=1 Tax=Simiduia sp. 21SJ11W-1 TaxID=2909669 RepID=UPI0020A18AF3|nr:c-type cytochrome [Simiduia sp. 21SJ11W-1]UTA47005.1 cytochrome c [Simiduia sp. 21SJ11W-1]